jgi:hypothetical protein
VFESQPSGISPSDFVLAAARGEGRSVIRDDWTFSLENLSAPTRLTLTAAPPGWWLKQLMVNGVNAAEVPVEFGTAARSRHGVTAVLARTAARISGLVLGDGATGIGGSPVVVFPVDQSRWAEKSLHAQRTRADQAGRYFVNVPPGEYWVAAADATPDAGVFEKLVTNAVRVTAGENADIVRDIRIAPPLAK